MDTPQLLVTLGGAALVAFILWFFFGPRTAVAAHAGSEAGRPIRIKFRRDDPNPCTDQVVFPDFGVVRDLPLGRVTAVEVTPPAPGEYPFHCGMNMVRGKLIVK